MRIAPFQLERYFAEHEFAVEYLLCSSDCEALTIAELLALEPGARERFDQHWLGYTEPAGSPSLRQAIAGLYRTISPEHVLVHSGAEEAIFLFMHAMLAPGDHLIVHSPCYQSLAEVARSLGCGVTPWRAQAAAGWALDPDELRRLIQPTTKALVINTPHNPTGYHMSAEVLLAIEHIAAREGLLLFSDEVYRECEYAPADRLPAACDLGEHGISLGVMSKTYGLAGLRIGWIATHHAGVQRQMALLKDYTTICNSAPSEFLAELALRHRQVLIARNLRLIHDNLTLLDEFFRYHAERFEWQRPLAGPIAFPRLRGEEVTAFCRDLLAQTSVLLLPGTVYGDQANHFRIGFGRRTVPQAIARLEEFLARRGLAHP